MLVYPDTVFHMCLDQDLEKLRKMIRQEIEELCVWVDKWVLQREHVQEQPWLLELCASLQDVEITASLPRLAKFHIDFHTR